MSGTKMIAPRIINSTHMIDTVAQMTPTTPIPCCLWMMVCVCPCGIRSTNSLTLDAKSPTWSTMKSSRRSSGDRVSRPDRSGLSADTMRVHSPRQFAYIGCQLLDVVRQRVDLRAELAVHAGELHGQVLRRRLDRQHARGQFGLRFLRRLDEPDCMQCRNRQRQGPYAPCERVHISRAAGTVR